MTVSTENRKVNAPGDGIQTNFPYNFKILVDSDLEVYFDDVLQIGGYTVNGAGVDAGGSVDFAVAPTALVIVTLYRNLPATQESDYEAYRDFPSETVEDDFDKATMLNQQTNEESDRSVKGPISDDGSFDYSLPAPVASKILGVNLAGTAFEMLDPIGVSYNFVPYIRATTEHNYLTAGGSSVSGSWQDYNNLGYIRDDTSSLASLLGGDLVLPAGTYRIKAGCIFFASGKVAIRLYDVTGAAALLGPGQCTFSPISSDAINHVVPLSGLFTLAVESPVKIQYWCSVSDITFGKGSPHNVSGIGNNIYQVLELWKRA